MATLTLQQTNPVGTSITLAAASGGGDKMAPAEHGGLMVVNGSGAPINVTLVVPGTTKYAQAQPAVVKAVAAGTTAIIGPLPTDLAGTDGLVAFTYSAVTTVTVAAVSI